MAYISKLTSMKLFCLIFLHINYCYSQTISNLEAFEKNEKTQSINISYAIRNLETDSLIYNHNGYKVFPPASTLKLITTGTALMQLGKEFRFNTILKTNGVIKSDTLFGDLIVDAYGDPTFGSKRFTVDPMLNFIESLQQNQIKYITGQIIYNLKDNSQTPLSWPIGDVGNYYGAFPQNLNYNENSFSVYFKSQKPLHELADITDISPKLTAYIITNKVRIAERNTGDNVYIMSLPFGNEIILTGTVPQYKESFEVKGAIPNIGVTFKEILTNRLNNNGINFIESQKLDSLNISIETEFYKNSSPRLSEIIKLCNFSSINFFADALANKLTRDDQNKDFDSFLKEYWSIKKLNLNAFKFIDGSGLSPENAISTTGMANFLSEMYKNENFSTFLESIPVMGQSGTVARLDRANITKGKVFVKSGSIGGVRNYAGYFNNKKGQLCSFAIFSNGFNSSNEAALKKYLENFLVNLIDLNQ